MTMTKPLPYAVISHSDPCDEIDVDWQYRTRLDMLHERGQVVEARQLQFAHHSVFGKLRQWLDGKHFDDDDPCDEMPHGWVAWWQLSGRFARGGPITIGCDMARSDNNVLSVYDGKERRFFPVMGEAGSETILPKRPCCAICGTRHGMRHQRHCQYRGIYR